MVKTGQETTVEYEGGPQFASDMERLQNELHDALGQALVEVAGGLVPHVQSVMPKVSGTLAGSVTVDPRQKKNLIVAVMARTPYAGWIEFGGTRGRPMMREGRYLFPVVMGSEPVVDTRLSEEVSKVIGGFPWSHTQT